MKTITLKKWLTLNQPRSFKHKELRIKYDCLECKKEIIKGPSFIKKKNLKRLFCSLECSTRYRNLHDGVPAQKEGWREKWLEASRKNGTLPIGEKNGRWIKDREARRFVAKNTFKYPQIIMYALINKYRTLGGRERFKNKHNYTPEQLKQHFENQFKDGMSWSNYGDWEVDHIKSVSKYLYKGVTDYKIINALSNLRPLWKHDNRRRNRV